MSETRRKVEPARIATVRRRETGSASARSLLLTTLGEFVHPHGTSVWTGSLIAALGALGVEEKSARQALSRTAAEGLLSSTRHGRRMLWTISETGTQILQEGTERIYGFMRRPQEWDGRWLVLTVAVPEAHRALRHRLRTQLTWLGLGSPSSGLWVTPDVDSAAAVHRVVRELDLDDHAFAWIGPASGIGQESRLLANAWDLDAVEQSYLAFLAAYTDRRVTTPREAFVAQVRLVQDWRRFPFEDPALPSELLDHDWPGPRAAALFHDRHSRWHRRAQQEWARLDDAEGAKP